MGAVWMYHIVIDLDNDLHRTKQVRPDHTPAYYLGSPVILAITVGVLYGLPKYQIGEPIIVPDLVDYTWHPRIAFAVIMCMFGILSCMGSAAMYVFTPVYAIDPDDYK